MQMCVQCFREFSREEFYELSLKPGLYLRCSKCRIGDNSEEVSLVKLKS